MNIWCRFYVEQGYSVVLEEFIYLNEAEDLAYYADDWSERKWFSNNSRGIVFFEKDVLLPDHIIDELKEKYTNQIKNAEQMLAILNNHKKEFLLK